MEHSERRRKIQEHLDAIERLQAELAVLPDASEAAPWPPGGYYWLFHIVAGVTLGFFGAVISLMFNVIGALAVGEPPLKLIQIYLTFPMGARALEVQQDQGAVLFVGCLLYIVTGALYGIAFHLLMTGFFKQASGFRRVMVGSMVGLSIWLVNFYAILSWLQPVLLGGNWIVAQVPVWVAAGTHLVFAWTMLVIEHFGHFEKKRAG